MFTLDALRTQHATAELFERAGAGYLMSANGNNPQPAQRRDRPELADQHRPEPGNVRAGMAAPKERLRHVVPAAGIDFWS